VIVSGGLGPTEDDLTREALAGALGIDLERREEVLASLENRFRARGMAMPTNNARQADVLRGAELLENRNGSAPGQFLVTVREGRQRIVVLLPGPPTELKALFEEAVKPRLSRLLPRRFLAKRLLRMALIPESLVDARTAPIYKAFADVETTILAGSAEIQLHFFCVKPTMQEAEVRLDALVGLVRAEMGDRVYSAMGESLEEVVLSLLEASGGRLSTAESCTGGLLAQRLTAVPGSSRAFLGGTVVYTEALKRLFADVPEALLVTAGAASAETARALAEGTRRRTGATLSVSVTGLAGPDGAPSGPDAAKPIGLVYIGLADGAGTMVKEVRLTGDRERIRWWASQHALEMARRRLLQLDPVQ
jgi:nicotinamide-nucleotide amidase